MTKNKFEFHVDNDDPIVLTGNIDVELPSYMLRLPETDHHNLSMKQLTNDEKSDIVIAAGTDKNGVLIMMTLTGLFFELELSTHTIPTNGCKPINCGRDIEFNDNKLILPTKLLIKRSKKMQVEINLNN